VSDMGENRYGYNVVQNSKQQTLCTVPGAISFGARASRPCTVYGSGCPFARTVLVVLVVSSAVLVCLWLLSGWLFGWLRWYCVVLCVWVVTVVSSSGLLRVAVPVGAVRCALRYDVGLVGRGFGVVCVCFGLGDSCFFG
jgi:hypothetical protein